MLESRECRISKVASYLADRANNEPVANFAIDWRFRLSIDANFSPSILILNTLPLKLTR